MYPTRGTKGNGLIPEDSDDTSPPTSPQGGLVDKLWPKRSRWGKVGVTVAVAFVFAALWLVGVFVGDQDEEAIASHNDGITLVEEGRWEDAVAAFTEAIELEPEDTDLLASAYRNRSVALGELGRIEEALTDASAAIDLQPADTDILAQAYVNRSVGPCSVGTVRRGGCRCLSSDRPPTRRHRHPGAGLCEPVGWTLLGWDGSKRRLPMPQQRSTSNPPTPTSWRRPM